MKQIVSVEIINKETKYKTVKEKQGEIVGGGFDSNFNYISTYSDIIKDVQVPYLVYTFRVHYSNGAVKVITCNQGTPKFKELLDFYERQKRAMEEQQELARRQQQQQAAASAQASASGAQQPQASQVAPPKLKESSVPGSKPLAEGEYIVGTDFPAGTFNFWTEDPEEEFGGVTLRLVKTNEIVFYRGELSKGDLCRAILKEGQLLEIEGKKMYVAKAEPVTFD